MNPGNYALLFPDKPAFIMAESGEAVSYRDYEARCNRMARYLRDQGLLCDRYWGGRTNRI